MNEKLLYIKNQISRLGIDLTEEQCRMFYSYYELLIEWNEKINLTAITDFEEVVEKHFVDSLSLVKAYDLNEKDISLIDIGTGAGFPGIPLKIAFPDLKVTLLDSLNKRIVFLNEVIEFNHLDQIETVHGRAEDFAKPDKLREKYDLCVSRAVANLSTLTEYCLPYVKIGGSFISYKSGDTKEEVDTAKSAIFLLGGKLDKVESFNLPDSDISRSLVCISKINGTSKKYPRKAGMASKNPL